jgi:hypothetical protein
VLWNYICALWHIITVKEANLNENVLYIPYRLGRRTFIYQVPYGKEYMDDYDNPLPSDNLYAKKHN